MDFGVRRERANSPLSSPYFTDIILTFLTPNLQQSLDSPVAFKTAPKKVLAACIFHSELLR
jgi:hypothetical protein